MLCSRRCFVYDCRHHFISQPPPYVLEAPVPVYPSPIPGLTLPTDVSVGKQKGDRTGDGLIGVGLGVGAIGKQVKIASVGVRKGSTNVVGVDETPSNSSSASSPQGNSINSKGRKRKLKADANDTSAIHSTSSPSIFPPSLPTSNNNSSSNNISSDIPHEVEQLEYCLYRHMLSLPSLQKPTVSNTNNKRTLSTSSLSMPLSKVSSRSTPLPSASLPSTSSSSRSVPSESSASLPWTEVEVTLLNKLGAVFGRTNMYVYSVVLYVVYMAACALIHTHTSIHSDICNTFILYHTHTYIQRPNCSSPRYTHPSRSSILLRFRPYSYRSTHKSSYHH